MRTDQNAKAGKTVAVYLTYGSFGGIGLSRERNIVRILPETRVLDEVARLVRKGTVTRVRIYGGWTWSK